MKILSRYVIKQHTAPFLFAFAALTGFMLLNQIARKLEQLVGKGLPWSVFVEFFLLTIPYLVAMTISMSVLVAVLYTFSHLARDSEITAFRAGGISLGQLFRPVLLAAAMVAVFSFLFQDQILPRTNHRLRTLMTAIGKAKPTFELKEHVINEVQRGQVFLRASMINQADYSMRDVTIYQYANRDPAIVYADSGRISFAPNNEDLLLELYYGTVHEFERRDYGNFQYTPFEKYVFKLEGIGSGDFVRPYEDNYYSDREMGTCELEDVVIDAKRQELLASRQAEAAQRNGLRSLIGLPLIQADTAVPTPRRSLYCRLLAALLPPELEAQEIPRIRHQPDDSTAAVARTRITPMTYASGRSTRARMNETRTQLERKRGNERRAAIYLVEFHKKYAIAAACIVFVLVGIPLALWFPGGLGMVIGFAMAIFAIYYVGLIAGESLANRLAITPFWAMWAPNVAFGVLGAIALWRTARQGVAAHRPDRRSKSWIFRAFPSTS